MAVKNSLTQAKPQGVNDVKFSQALQVSSIQTLIQNTLNDQKKKDKFITAISTIVAQNPKLQECTNTSLVAAGLVGASLNLSPAPQFGYFHFVPYKNTKENVTEAQFQMGYKGYLQLAIKSNNYRNINVLEIKESEFVSYNPLTEELKVKMNENPTAREKEKTVGYYAMFEMLNGFTKSMYWTFEQMRTHADTYSKAYSAKEHDVLLSGKVKQADLWKYSSFWYKNFDEMAKKTMLRQLISKWGDMSTDEMDRAYRADQSVVKDPNKLEVDYVDGVDIGDITPDVEVEQVAVEVIDHEQELKDVEPPIDDSEDLPFG